MTSGSNPTSNKPKWVKSSAELEGALHMQAVSHKRVVQDYEHQLKEVQTDLAACRGEILLLNAGMAPNHLSEVYGKLCTCVILFLFSPFN